MRKNIQASLYAIVIILILSCSNSNDDISGEYFLTKSVTYDLRGNALCCSEFEYDDSNHLTRYKYKGKDDYSLSWNDGQVTEIKRKSIVGESAKYILKYKEDKVVNVNKVSDIDLRESNFTYVYLDDLIEQIVERNLDGKIINTENITYNSSGDIRTCSSCPGEKNEYDSHRNYLSYMKLNSVVSYILFQDSALSKHNITSRENGESKDSYKYSYRGERPDEVKRISLVGKDVTLSIVRFDYCLE